MCEPALTLSASARLRRSSGERFELSAEDGDEVFRLDDPAVAILTLFDGVRTLEDVLVTAGRRGLSAPRSTLESFVRSLADAGLLVPSSTLPLRTVPGARLVCTGCTHCCHLHVGPLTDADLTQLEALDWAAVGLRTPTPWLQRGEPGEAYLAQTPEGPCVFLDDDGLCRIHRHFGEEAKPSPCRQYPLNGVRRGGEVRLGCTYECRGLAQAHEEGRLLSDEAVALEPSIRRTLESQPVLQAADPGQRMWRSVAGPDAPKAPEAGLAALGQAVCEVVPEGQVGLDALLDDLRELARESLAAISSPRLRHEQEAMVRGLDDLARGTPPPRARHAADRPPLSTFYLGWLRNQVFIGEPLGYLRIAGHVSLLVVTYLLGRRLACSLADAAGRDAVTLEDAAEGLGRAQGGFRCVRRLDAVSGVGARCIREALARL